MPLPLLLGCPFKVDEYVVRCNTAKDCSDGNACTEDKCTMGICENPPKPKGTGCGPASASVCDGMGNCIECLTNTDCQANHPMTPVCDTKAQKCVSCFDGVKNGKETDIDCGGPDCGACLGQPCEPSNGCGNGTFCALQDGVCCDAVCGEKCQACVKGKTGQPDGTCAPIPYSMDPDNECTTAGGCGSTPGKCRCEDGVKNSDETDVDCGGAVCPRCGGGDTCGMDTDCAVEVPTCTAEKKCCTSLCDATCFVCNFAGQCVGQPVGYNDPTCPVNQACGPVGTSMPCQGKFGAMCSSNGRCLSGICVGGMCAKSQIGKPCSGDTDCAAGTCQNYVCTL